jgi:hypothetical protein
MAIKPNFKRADIDTHIKKKLATIDRQIIARLRVLGSMCVTMARNPGNNDPAGFPISYGNPKNPQPLKHRVLTQADKNKSQHVVAPVFGDFITWTGNLISSISYFIVRDGKIIESDLGTEETATTQRIAKKRASGMKRGYGLVLVAGAKYAASVEANGYDVLTSSELWAKKQLPKLLKQIAKDRKA